MKASVMSCLRLARPTWWSGTVRASSQIVAEPPPRRQLLLERPGIGRAARRQRDQRQIRARGELRQAERGRLAAVEADRSKLWQRGGERSEIVGAVAADRSVEASSAGGAADR